MILLAALLLEGSAVADLDAELRASTSATATLQARCAVPICAEVDRAATKRADRTVRAHLGAGKGIRLVYRLVRLTCDGGRLLAGGELVSARPAERRDERRAALR